MNAVCAECMKQFGLEEAALPNVSLCEMHLRVGNALAAETRPQPMTFDGVRAFTLEAEQERIVRIEQALYLLDMATALRVLEYVRSRVIGNGAFK